MLDFGYSIIYIHWIYIKLKIVMIRIAVIVANKSEDIETIVPVDIWRRAGLIVKLISIEKKKSLILSYGSKLSCDDVLSKENLSKYNAIYLPGGEGHLKFNDVDAPRLISFLNKYGSSPQIVFMAMCASPEVYGGLGMLKSVKFTCYPGYEKKFAKTYVNKGVVVDKNFITAKSAAYAVPFALAAVAKLINKDAAQKVAKEICYTDKI